MSLALRHRPDRFGLTPDSAGWVPVADLLAALRVSRSALDEVVAGNDKQRFAVERGTDGVDRVRASQGHRAVRRFIGDSLLSSAIISA